MNDLCKGELVYSSSWKNREAGELTILSWVDWLTHRRLTGPIGIYRRRKPKRLLSHQGHASRNSVTQIRQSRRYSGRLSVPVICALQYPCAEVFSFVHLGLARGYVSTC